MDYTVGDTIYLMFTTRQFSDGVPTVLAGTPVISAYENDSVTQITAGITLGVSHDSVVGMNLLTIVATGANGYESGKDYNMVITTGTVGGVSVVGEVVATFSLGRSAAAGDLANGTDGLSALKTLIDALPTAATIADAVQDEPIEDHDTQGNVGWATALAVYAGPDGPGIYIDSGAANTSTVVGTDGTEINPVSTFAAARTVADALGLKVYYLEGNSDITLAATHEDWEFIGIGSVADNVVNLGSQDVDRSLFRNLTLEGTQGGTGRITARDCALQDPGAGATTLHIFAERCGIVDDISIDTSADNVFDECFSLAASGVAPVITATGAAGSIVLSHYGGKIELKSLSASHNIELDGHGALIFNADCNVNANLFVHGVWAVTDNTAGMSDLATMTGLVNMTKINAEADTALTDYDGPTNAEMEARTIVSANYALASVLGALNDAAAAGDVTTADTLMQYLKQVINLLAGGPGIATNPSAAVPANAVNVFEILNSLSDRLPAALASGNIKADLLAISGDSTAADRLEALMDGIVVAQVNDGSATTTAFAADGFTEATDDHFKGRLITFISGALSGQQTDITGYNAAGGAQGSQEFTVTALTEAPAEDVFFVIH